MNQGRSDRHLELETIAQAFGIRFIYLFGSQAALGKRYLAGELAVLDDPLADLDVGVVLLNGANLSPLDRANLYGDLSNRLQGLFKPFDVDLVLLDETHSVFQAEAIAGHCIYAASDKTREEYEIGVLTRAADFRPVLETFYRERLEDL